jgi:hypothetical protein
MIDCLESVVASNYLSCYVNENSIEHIPFETTHECDMTREDVYATLVDEEDSDQARTNSVGASSQVRIFVLIKGSNSALDNTCLQSIECSAPALAYLLNLGWTQQTLAVVNYRALDKQKFQHTVDFILPPSTVCEYPTDLCRDIASGAEWVIPKKKEQSDSQDFIRHTRRIAISLARDILRGYAAQLLIQLENKETDDMRLRLFEAYLPTDGSDFRSVLDQIEMKKKEIDRMMTQLEAYKRKLIDKSYDPYARVTELGEAATTLRDKVEKADAEALAFKIKREREISQLQSKVADAGKGKRLRETAETSWVFRWFHSSSEPNAMHTPSIRTILSDSEAHPNVATVNETLMRLGKQSNVQLFCESVIPFVPLCRSQ